MNKTLSVNKMNPLCSLCGGGIKTFWCGKCKSIKYCSIECQKEDWKRHKLVCDDSKKGYENRMLTKSIISKINLFLGYYTYYAHIKKKFKYPSCLITIVAPTILITHDVKYKVTFSLKANQQQFVAISYPVKIPAEKLPILIESCFENAQTDPKVYHIMLLPSLEDVKEDYDKLYKQNPLIVSSDEMIIYISKNMEDMNVEYTLNGKKCIWQYLNTH